MGQAIGTGQSSAVALSLLRTMPLMRAIQATRGVAATCITKTRFFGRQLQHALLAVALAVSKLKCAISECYFGHQVDC